MIIDCIADLHGYYPKLEGGDVLIVAGDLTAKDLSSERHMFLQWLAEQDYKKKIWIAGNHDNSLVGLTFSKTRPEGAEYLCDSGTEFEGLKIWGSPWTKTFHGMNPKCKAFTCDTEEELAIKFSLIPDDVDILVTHSPPYGILDGIPMQDCNDGTYFHAGSINLRNHSINRVKPKIHIYGHIHEHGGKMIDCNTTKFINASHVNEFYEPVNAPVRVIL